jgi:hypothetical protein
MWWQGLKTRNAGNSLHFWRRQAEWKGMAALWLV